jgi:hypothetical protein
MLRAPMWPQQIQHPLNAFLSTKNSLPFDKSWKEFRPRSFLPIYAPEADHPRGEAFPEIWYLNHCHVAGIQYSELASILLVVHNPNVPRMGPSHRAAMHSVDQTLRSIVL